MLRDDRTVPPVIREIHPELCFWAFAGRKPMKHCKKDGAGFRERLDVLKRIRPSAAQEIERTLSEFKPNGKHVARDDAVDAMVAALTAAAKATALRTLPAKPPRDAFRLPIQTPDGDGLRSAGRDVKSMHRPLPGPGQLFVGQLRRTRVDSLCERLVGLDWPADDRRTGAGLSVHGFGSPVDSSSGRGVERGHDER